MAEGHGRLIHSDGDMYIGNGEKIKHMEMENISIVMVQLMKDNEIKINSMVKAKNYSFMPIENVAPQKNEKRKLKKKKISIKQTFEINQINYN